MDNISVDKLSTRTHKNISSKIFAPLVLVRGGAGTARRGVLTATETGDWRLGPRLAAAGPSTCRPAYTDTAAHLVSGDFGYSGMDKLYLE